MKQLIQQKGIEPPPERIVWLYAEDQPLYKQIEHVEFIQGIPHDLETMFDVNQRNLLILDD